MIVNYEIDFLLTQGSKICPVEVKSSGYKTHASLDAFKAKYSDRILWNYLIYTKDLRKDGDIILLAAFLTISCNHHRCRNFNFKLPAG